jgi:hypothetical protein
MEDEFVVAMDSMTTLGVKVAAAIMLSVLPL